MKNTLSLSLFGLTICLLSSTAFANTEQQKINIVKNIYAEANKGRDWVNILPKYADTNFKSHIKNREFCDVDALWGNQDPQFPTKVNVTSSSNGKIKATFKQYGEQYNNYFTFKCQGNSCKITQVLYYSCE